MQIGAIKLHKPLALAPMEDVTDMAFRRLCKRLGADLVYTEFTASEALIRDVKSALHKIRVCDEERPVAIQIFGGRNEAMEEAARIAETFRPDFIDINCGCWVKNVVKRNEGAGLLRDINAMEKIVKATIKGTSLPVTVKTRLGWDHDNIVILDVAKMLEQAGCQALTVHCRTRNQGYKGFADWEWLYKLKQTVSMPIIGNGDITMPEDVEAMFETGCDGVMIGRGAIANPWIFQQSKHYLSTGNVLPPPSIKDRIELCLEHLKMSIEERGNKAILSFRKHYGGYLKGLPHIADVRQDLMQLKEFDAIEERLNHFLEDFHEKI